jgi:hypothetical protein
MLTIFQQSHGPIEAKFETSELDPKLLLQAPIPRTVKMGWPIKVQIAICALFFTAILAWWTGDTAAPTKNADYMERLAPIFVFFLLVAIVSSEVIQELRNRRLLQFGNCVQGRVVDRIKATVGRRRRSMIVYQFAVGPGKPMTAKGNDHTNSYSRNSSVLVFFDPERLERNVAICCTGWQVRDEQGHILEP